MLNLSMFEIVTLSESLISTYNQHHPDDHRNHLKIVARSDLENFFSPSESSCITDASSRNRSPDVPLLHLLVATQEHFKFSLLEKGIDRSRDLANGATGEEGKSERGEREMDCVTRPAENTPKGHGSTSLHLAAIHQIFGFNGLIPSLHEYRSLGYFSPRARFIINPYTRIPASVLRQFEFPKIEESRIDIN